MTQSLSLEHTARPGHPVRAVVHAAGIDTEYLRAGRGDAVVVVAEDLDSAETYGLIASLETRYLVLAASPRLSKGIALSVWLNAFLEGLGVPSAHLFVHSSMTLCFDSGDPDHV